ncbi:MAG TPA: hypothetical protein VFF78_06905 [Anaerolineaceae bacterium]|nr:hypothetical protein [Anaerolineaceae bacterium]
MKRNFFNILAVLALIFSLVNAVQPAFASQLAQEIKAAITPTTISYQGLVKVDGQPFTGTGYFKFAIVSANGSVSHWSNDNTSVGGGAPTNPVPLPVSDGLFSVRLGDTTLSGMTRIIDAQTMWMAGRNCLLRVWFSPDGVAAYTQLSPDRAFSSAPFALVAEYAVESSTLNGYSAGDFQQRVSGACAAGSTVQSVNADGTVNCLPLPINMGHVLTTVDNSANVGWYTSIAIGADGLPLISYYNVTDFNLKVAHCDDLACSTATITTLDSAGSVGTHTAITIGADGLGLISYRDYTNLDLKVAHCSNIQCSAATITTLDGANNVGEYTSIATNDLGYGIISYIDLTNNDLMFARCLNSTCSSSTLKVLDNGVISGSTSISTDHRGNPIVSYRDGGSSDLKMARCGQNTCYTVSINTIDSTSNVSNYSSITTGSDGLSVISYYDSTNQDLKVAHCEDYNCSTVSIAIVDEYEDAGKYSSIIIGSDGLPIIAYYTYYPTITNGRLMIAHCSTVSCDAATPHKLDQDVNNTGLYTSIAIGMDGLPIISYYSENPGDLNVIHCANTLCGFHRRGR